MQSVLDTNTGSTGLVSWYNRILDASPDGIITLQCVRSAAGEIMDFIIVQCNKAGCKMTGLPPNAAGHRLLQVLPSFKEAGYFDICRQVVQAGQSYTCGFSLHPHHTGESHYSMTINKLDDGLVVNLNDISRFRMLGRAAEKKATLPHASATTGHNIPELDEKNRLLDSVFNSSLVGISVMQIIRNEKGEAIDLINKVLNNKAARGNHTRDQLFSGTYLSCYPEAKSAGLAPKDISIIDHAAKAALRMHDLIHGLLTYSRVGSDHAERIFNMFQRLHGNNEYQGTGIGLAIVKKVMDNHRGYANAVGEPDKGATFRLLFPHL